MNITLTIRQFVSRLEYEKYDRMRHIVRIQEGMFQLHQLENLMRAIKRRDLL